MKGLFEYYGKIYYAIPAEPNKPETGGKLAKSEKRKVGGGTYIFSPLCFAYIGATWIDDKLYYARDDGKLVMQGMFKDEDGNQRYAKPGTGGELAVDEIITINKIEHHFDDDGICYKIVKYGKEILLR